MILSIPIFDDQEERDDLLRKIGALTWRDGRATAGTAAQPVKVNQQAIMSDRGGRQLAQALTKRIVDHPIVRAAARPKRFSPLIVSKTVTGGHYGPHMDNAMMGHGDARMRTDLSFTLFLTDPEAYDGGDLAIHTAGAVQSVKGRAGELVLYPSTCIHEVRPVTRGERVVSVGWIESLIPDLAQRELLFDLENLRVSLRERAAPVSAELLMIDKTIANLMRMWARP